MADISVYVMLFLGLGGVIALIVWMSFLTQNKDNGAEIQKNLAVITGLIGVLVGLFGFACFIYFNANTNYLTPFLMIMTFVNMLLSLVAVSAASLQITKA